MEANRLRSPANPAQRFDYIPIGFFGSVMGLCGLSVAWSLAHARFGVPLAIGQSIGALAAFAFVALAIAYVAKAIVAPDAVAKEFAHPIAGSLFGTVFISLLLMPIVLAPLNLWIARVIWIVGAIGMFVFAWLMMNRWMTNRQQAEHATPAWIIPVVGTLDVPLALPSLGLPPLHGVMVLALSIGLFFTIPIFTLIFSRLLFEAPLPDALQPMLLILVAPFAVGFTSYVVTMGTTDLFAQSLFALTIFLLSVLLGPHASVDRVLPVSNRVVGGELPARRICDCRPAHGHGRSEPDHDSARRHAPCGIERRHNSITRANDPRPRAR